jgi:hypothetical protein
MRRVSKLGAFFLVFIFLEILELMKDKKIKRVDFFLIKATIG